MNRHRDLCRPIVCGFGRIDQHPQAVALRYGGEGIVEVHQLAFAVVQRRAGHRLQFACVGELRLHVAHVDDCPRLDPVHADGDALDQLDVAVIIVGRVAGRIDHVVGHLADWRQIVRLLPCEAAVAVAGVAQHGIAEALSGADTARSGPVDRRGRRLGDVHRARSHAADGVVRRVRTGQRDAREGHRLVRTRIGVADACAGVGRIHAHIVARQRAVQRPALPGQRHVGGAVVGKVCGGLRIDRDLPRRDVHAGVQLVQYIVACRSAGEVCQDDDGLARSGMHILHLGADEIQLHFIVAEGRIALGPGQRAFHVGGAVVFAVRRACGGAQRAGTDHGVNHSYVFACVVPLERNRRGIRARIAQRSVVEHRNGVVLVCQNPAVDLELECIGIHHRARVDLLVGESVIRNRVRIHRQGDSFGGQAIVVRQSAVQRQLQRIRARLRDGERLAVGPRQRHIRRSEA